MFEIGKSYVFTINLDEESRNFFGYVTKIEMPLVEINSADEGVRIINVHSSGFIKATQMNEDDLELPMPILGED